MNSLRVTRRNSRDSPGKNCSSSPTKRLKIVERYNMKSASPQPNSSGETYRRQQELQTEVNRKKQKLSQLREQISNEKTKNRKQEFDNWVIEDKLNALRKELDVSKENIVNLRVYEKDSMRTIRNIFDLKKKEIDVEFNEKLVKLKDTFSEQIESSMAEARSKSVLRMESLQAEVSHLSGEIQNHSSDMNRKLIKIKEDHHKRLMQLRTDMEAILAEIQMESSTLENEMKTKVGEIDSLKSTLDTDMTSTAQLSEKLSLLQETHSVKVQDIQLLESELASTKSKAQTLEISLCDKQETIKEYNALANALRDSFASFENERRVLHNKLQELKGNIRVFCRIRPSLNPLTPLTLMSIDSRDQFTEDGKQVLVLETPSMVSNTAAPSSAGVASSSSLFSNAPRKNTYKFEFDKIFSQEATNSDIFLEISQLIQCSLDGFNVCVFAYGQTGSGKTWTMSHRCDGMIPQSIVKIFSDIQSLRTQGWEYSVYGQFIEIYNESIIDLLSTGNKDVKLEIKHDDMAQTTSITNCTVVEIVSEESAVSLLERASENRSTASTMVNSRSSRSHSAFILKINGVHKASGKVSSGTLNLIDLAGSERLTASQARGDRLKETQAINKSLSCLGDVIYSLGQAQNQGNDTCPIHIPYRNSKLTYLLKHSLGGDSKTLMFVNVSPYAENFNETVNSLRFATKVNNTKLG